MPLRQVHNVNQFNDFVQNNDLSVMGYRQNYNAQQEVESSPHLSNALVDEINRLDNVKGAITFLKKNQFYSNKTNNH